MLATVETWAVHTLRFAVHIIVVCGIISEALKTCHRRGDHTPGYGVVAARVLASLVYDALLGLVSASGGFSRCMGSALFNDDSAAILRRFAVLYSSMIALLYVSAILRWRRASAKYKAAPLFPFMVYFVVPWCNMSAWLVELRPGDNMLGGSLLLDLSALSLLLGVRSVLFGRQGYSRAPSTPQTFVQVAQDLVILGCLAAMYDTMILRSIWLERCRNWKYVLCAANLAWPWFCLADLVHFFRNESSSARSRRAAAHHKPTHNPHAGVQHSGDARLQGTSGPEHMGWDERSQGAGAGDCTALEQAPLPAAAERRPRRAATATLPAPQGYFAPPAGAPPPGMPLAKRRTPKGRT